MKALIIGGTGVISSAVVSLALEKGWDITLLNRGKSTLPSGVKSVVADIHDEAAVKAALAGMKFDVVAQFIAYTKEDIERDIRIFDGMTRQYIFISSASAYQKPVLDYRITEGTPLVNPYWQYSRDKADCEAALMAAHLKNGFPFTSVRPSHTYCERKIPVALHGGNGSWQVVQRIIDGKPVIIPGDGTTLWTLTYASDFAKGFVGLMGNKHAIANAYHITSDESMTWNMIHEEIAKALGKPLNAYHVASDFLAACGKQYDFSGPLFGDKANTVTFDNTKIKRTVPEFNCTVSMSDGIRKAVEYMLAHKELQVPDPDFDEWCDKVIAAQENAKKGF